MRPDKGKGGAPDHRRRRPRNHRPSSPPVGFIVAPECGVEAQPTCPDCHGRWAEVDSRLVFTHDRGCPAGMALDAMRAEDRAWFDEHPNAPFRFRAIHYGEMLDLRAFVHVEDPFLAQWRVQVFNVEPGTRLKKFFTAAGEQW